MEMESQTLLEARRKIDLDVEIARTKPDYIVYRPASENPETGDTGNEHFLVFECADQTLGAVWTQSTKEGDANQKLVFSKSRDQGETWSSPLTIAGPMASWGFPMVSKSGRIYVLFNKHIGVNDLFTHTTGLMAGIYSDDHGRTWSAEQIIPMPKSKWDNPDPAVPANWIVWQKPERLSEGKYFVGFTRWVSREVRHKPPINSWIAEEAVVEFMRFENLDDNPEPEDMEISFIAFGDAALRAAFPGHPEISVVQEPSIVKLPDARLFCVMRTSTGHPYYSVSGDAGFSWTKPEVLRYSDSSEALRHPLSPCPIYRVSENRYIILFHNNNGYFEQWTPVDTLYHRRPVYLAAGTFRPEAVQPLEFSQAVKLMDNQGVRLGPGGRADLAMYASTTVSHNGIILWYPERKFFLLGKKIELV